MKLFRVAKLDSKTAELTSLYFFALLFWAIGIAAALAFVLTAKWYMVGVAFAVCSGGWILLYKFFDGYYLPKWPVHVAEKSQDATIPAPAKANFPWTPGLK